MTAHAVWQLVGTEPLRWSCWDGECVVYDPFSGDTHYLDVPASAVLRQIEASAQSTAALAAHVAALLEIDDLPVVSANVERLLQRLSELGLIEAAPAA